MAFLKPLLARVTAGVDAVAAAARSGVLRVDDEPICRHCPQRTKTQK